MKRILAKTANAACIMFAVLMAWFLAMGYVSPAELRPQPHGKPVRGRSAWPRCKPSGSPVLPEKSAYPARIAGFGACGLPVIALRPGWASGSPRSGRERMGRLRRGLPVHSGEA